MESSAREVCPADHTELRERYGDAVLTTGRTAEVLRCSGKIVKRLFDKGMLEGYHVPDSLDRRIFARSVAELLQQWGRRTVALDIAVYGDASCDPRALDDDEVLTPQQVADTFRMSDLKARTWMKKAKIGYTLPPSESGLEQRRVSVGELVEKLASEKDAGTLLDLLNSTRPPPRVALLDREKRAMHPLAPYFPPYRGIHPLVLAQSMAEYEQVARRHCIAALLIHQTGMEGLAPHETLRRTETVPRPNGKEEVPALLVADDSYMAAEYPRRGIFPDEKIVCLSDPVDAARRIHAVLGWEFRPRETQHASHHIS